MPGTACHLTNVLLHQGPAASPPESTPAPAEAALSVSTGRLEIVEPRDVAVRTYSAWQSSQVSDRALKIEYQKVCCAITLDEAVIPSKFYRQTFDVVCACLSILPPCGRWSSLVAPAITGLISELGLVDGMSDWRDSSPLTESHKASASGGTEAGLLTAIRRFRLSQRQKHVLKKTPARKLETAMEATDPAERPRLIGMPASWSVV